MSSNSNSAIASLALTATLALSTLPDSFTTNTASERDALSRIEAIRDALKGGGHSVLQRDNPDSGYVVTQFNQNFSNSFQKAKGCTTSNTC
jgi:hypothetical protein